jgi:hypothetical protein
MHLFYILSFLVSTKHCRKNAQFLTHLEIGCKKVVVNIVRTACCGKSEQVVITF